MKGTAGFERVDWMTGEAAVCRGVSPESAAPAVRIMADWLLPALVARDKL